MDALTSEERRGREALDDLLEFLARCDAPPRWAIHLTVTATTDDGEPLL